MSFNSIHPDVQVGQPTKASEYNRLNANIKWLKDRVDSDNNEGSNAAGHTHTGSGDGAQIDTSAIASNAVTESKIATIDLPAAAKIYVVSISNYTSIDLWYVDFEDSPGRHQFVGPSNNIEGRLVADTKGLYFVGGQATFAGASSPGQAQLLIKDNAGTLLVTGSTYMDQSEAISVTANCIIPLEAGQYIRYILERSGNCSLSVGIDRSFMFIYRLPWSFAY